MLAEMVHGMVRATSAVKSRLPCRSSVPSPMTCMVETSRGFGFFFNGIEPRCLVVEGAAGVGYSFLNPPLAVMGIGTEVMFSSLNPIYGAFVGNAFRLAARVWEHGVRSIAGRQSRVSVGKRYFVLMLRGRIGACIAGSHAHRRVTASQSSTSKI